MKNKYLEAIDNLWANLVYNDYTEKNSVKDRNLLIEAVNRLEAIDNANFSNALEETLRDIAYDLANDDNPFLRDRYYGLVDVKLELVKAKEQERLLSIIKKKCLTNCNLALVKNNIRYKNYCDEFKEFAQSGEMLTEEEFYLIKEWTRDE